MVVNYEPVLFELTRLLIVGVLVYLRYTEELIPLLCKVMILLGYLVSLGESLLCPYLAVEVTFMLLCPRSDEDVFLRIFTIILSQCHKCNIAGIYTGLYLLLEHYHLTIEFYFYLLISHTGIGIPGHLMYYRLYVVAFACSEKANLILSYELSYR